MPTSLGMDESVPQPEREYLGGRHEVATHMLALGSRVAVSVVAEPDWEVVHGYLQVPLDPLAEEVEPLLVDVAEDVCDARWARRSVIVQYAAGGRLYSFRSVVRAVGHGGMVLDSPSEISLRGAPPKQGRARANGATDGRGFRLVGLVRSDRDAATRLIAGGALHTQVVQRAAKINNLRKVNEVIGELAMQPSVALTVEGTTILHPVRVNKISLRNGYRCLGLTPQGPLPAQMRLKLPVWLTAMVGGHMCSMQGLVRRIDGDMLFVSEPTEVYRYQRRRMGRVTVVHTDIPFFLERRGEALGRIFRVEDLSLGGMGALIPGELPLEPGSQVDILLALTEDRAVELPARCVFRVASGLGFDRAGFQFVNLDAQRLRVVDRLIRRLGGTPL